jgi:hypothetical protein
MTTTDFVATGADFTVTAHPEARTPPGDGSDEDTSWVFEIGHGYPVGGRVVSALLTVELTPAHAGVNSDFVVVEGLRHFRSRLWYGLPPGHRSTLDVQLLEYFDAEDLGRVLRTGRVGMTWIDDATIHSAELLVRVLVV